MIPDLSDGRTDPVEILAVAEWSRTLRGWFIEKMGSDQLLIDCRELDATRWSQDNELSLMRTIVRMNNPARVWILQNAGQDVDGWDQMSVLDRPVFTSYFPDQFSWMVPVLFLPTWIAVYLSLPEVQFAKGIGEESFRAMREHLEGASDLTVPQEIGDVLAIDLSASNRFARTSRKLDLEKPRDS